MKRVFLLIATNLAIILVLGIIARLIGVDRFITTGGMNYAALLGMASIMGFGGAFISLALSKWMAKMTTGAKVITEPQDQVQYWLMNTIRRQAAQAGIGMPEVAIFDSPEPNAFATGMSRNNALVAVSTGLINTMTQDEVEAVLGHEISHVANGDMITLTLVQGVMNTFVYFLARVVGYAVDRFFKGENDSGGVGIGYYLTSIVMELTLGILAGMVVAWVSRQREFRADAGGAHLAGSRKMVDALRRLQSMQDAPALPGSMAAFGISGGMSKLGALFASHPPLEDRIRALQDQAGQGR